MVRVGDERTVSNACAPVICTTYAMATPTRLIGCGSKVLLLLFFVFSLAERKNENNNEDKVPFAITLAQFHESYLAFGTHRIA
jgi:hypothetical protein